MKSLDKLLYNPLAFTVFLLVIILSEKLTASGNNPVRLSSEGVNAHSSYFTEDLQGNTMVSWIEDDLQTKEGVMVYTSFKKENSSLPVIRIESTRGLTSSGGECPPKLAVHKNGSIYAFYRMNSPTETNRFAGDIFYVISKDNGKSWSVPSSIFPDDNKDKSRGYFDVKRLPDGEVGIIWLEGKATDDTISRGSSVNFSTTQAGKEFKKPIRISRNACQCCKTKLFIGSKNTIHVVYREIFADGSRDMAHAYSTDTGKKFSKPVNISPDKWYIQGCPHVGPDMTEVKGVLYFSWFTMGGKGGIYGTHSKDGGKKFEKRYELVNTEAGSWPQMAGLKNNGRILAWEESFEKEGKYLQKIGVKIFDSTQELESFYLDLSENARRPVVFSCHHSFLLSFTKSEGDIDGVYIAEIQMLK